MPHKEDNIFAGSNVSRLALHAMSEIALAQKTQQTKNDSNNCLYEIISWACDSSQTIQPNEMRKILLKQLPADLIVDSLIPEAAYWLGNQWVKDEMHFVGVTKASAKLQQLVWAFTDHLDHRLLHTAPNICSILVVVPQFCHHTLGSVVLHHQLTREGIAAHLAMGLAPEELGQKVATYDFDSIFLSVSTREHLELTRKLLVFLKNIVASRTPIILGGRLARNMSQADDCGGADMVCDNYQEALNFVQRSRKPNRVWPERRA